MTATCAWRRRIVSACAPVILVMLALLTPADGQEYEIGGPLAGVKLPLYKTQHGEPAGYPGYLADEKGDFAFPAEARSKYPELELYPRAVERWRDYWLKYTPSRSLFDRQSLLKNWLASDLPGVPADRVEMYAEPVYFVPRDGVGSAAVQTDKTNKPVKVVRCGVGNPVLTLDAGTLDIGLYCVRVIAAVKGAEVLATDLGKDDFRQLREPLYVKMTVNDGLKGETNSYRMSVGYLDEFYSTAEFYFHALEKRAYTITLQVDRGSEVELLVHNVTLDDALAGATRRAIKTRRTVHPAPALPKEGWKQTRSREERLRRDAEIWEQFPHINAQPYATPFGSMDHNFGVGWPGLGQKLAKDIREEYGEWTAGTGDIFMVNKKLGLEYSISDFRAGKPLPDPYPYKDDGAGLFSLDMETKYSRNDLRARIWSPIAWEVQKRFGGADPKAWTETLSTEAFRKKGDLDNARDVAMRLIRFAYDYPSITFANGLTTAARKTTSYRTIVFRFRRRPTDAYLYRYRDLRETYDQLFDYIKDNEELAQSVGRFVPWVKTPQDVIRLIDIYLIQTDAKRIMRYQMYEDGRQPAEIANVAAILGDPKATDDWMEWLFARAYVYPYPVSGIQDIMISCCKRDGSRYVARDTPFYAQDYGAMQFAQSLDRYLESGGNRAYDLSDPARYPKPLARCYSELAMMIGGWQSPRIESAGKPGGDLSASFPCLLSAAGPGWRWSNDPKFAYAVTHGVGRTTETDTEWAALEAAAAKLPRAPWLDNRSRVVLPMVAVLESGLGHDDYRFRRSACLRVGSQFGRDLRALPSVDTLDLQIAAHGLPVTVSAGPIVRTSAGEDGSRYASSYGLNLVAVDDTPNVGHSWVTALSDAEGARYLQAAMVHSGAAKLYRRQLALIDVDEGTGSQPLPIAQQIPGAELPKGVTPGDSYVFDVVRVAGGRRHTYQFHANISEDFAWNAEDVKTAADDPMLAGFDHPQYPQESAQKFAGRCPEVFEATWRLRREARGKGPDGKPRRYMGSEEQLLGKNFDPASPPEFTRLYLFGVGGSEARRGERMDTGGKPQFNYLSQVTHVLVSRTGAGDDLESAFAAIIEPYAGKPFITESRLLPIAGNESDALRAAAVEVKTANGRTDLCFADGRPDKVRHVLLGSGTGFQPVQAQDHGQDARATIASEFAYVCIDAQGLRQATITGGTRLEAPEVKLVLAAREHTGKVVAVDYPNRTFRIDALWPARDAESVLEIGVPGHMTTYTGTGIEPDAAGTTISVSEGADYYRSEIVAVDENAGTVKCVLDFPHAPMPGASKDWVASNDAMTAFWRAEVLEEGKFKLTPTEVAGASIPVSAAAFGKSQRLRLWEYGPGDMVRQSTSASLRRVAPGVYELRADVDVEVTLPDGAVHRVSADELLAKGGAVELRAE